MYKYIIHEVVVVAGITHATVIRPAVTYINTLCKDKELEASDLNAAMQN